MKLPILILSAMLFYADAPAPQLSTAEKTAIQALENQKKQAQDQFMQAQQAESTIEQDFAQAHPGWYINAMTLQIEKKDAPHAAGSPPPPEKKQ